MTVLIVGGIFREILAADTARRIRMGGSGLTAALVSARLGAKTTLASYVGDEDAATVFALLDTVVVDRSPVAVLPGASGTFLFPSEEDPMRPWPMYRPAEAVPEPSPLALRSDVSVVFGIPDFDAIDAGWLGLDGDDALLWDRQGFLSRARDWRSAAALAPAQKIYLANLTEAREEFPAASATESLALLPPAGFSAAVVKRGPEGCTVIEAGTLDVPGFPVEDRPTIGSGDAFAGGLAAALDRGVGLVDAARQANAAAATFLETGNALADHYVDRVNELVGSDL